MQPSTTSFKAKLKLFQLCFGTNEKAPNALFAIHPSVFLFAGLGSESQLGKQNIPDVCSSWCFLQMQDQRKVLQDPLGDSVPPAQTPPEVFSHLFMPEGRFPNWLLDSTMQHTEEQMVYYMSAADDTLIAFLCSIVA